MKRFAVIALAIIGMAMPALAGDTTWLGTAGDNDWLNPDNWSAGVPTPYNTIAVFDSAVGANTTLDIKPGVPTADPNDPLNGAPYQATWGRPTFGGIVYSNTGGSLTLTKTLDPGRGGALCGSGGDPNRPYQIDVASENSTLIMPDGDDCYGYIGNPSFHVAANSYLDLGDEINTNGVTINLAGPGTLRMGNHYGFQNTFVLSDNGTVQMDYKRSALLPQTVSGTGNFNIRYTHGYGDEFATLAAESFDITGKLTLKTSDGLSTPTRVFLVHPTKAYFVSCRP